MIRNLLATTAIATLIATGGAMAQATTAPAPATDPAATAQPAAPMVKKAEGELGSNLIGANVYNGTGDDAENIGKVNDIVIGPNGDVEALVVGVGGFLGLGQKNVALQYDLASWVERDNDRFIVIETTEDALKALQDFDTAAYEPMPADADVAEVKPATQEELKAAESQAAASTDAAATDTAAPADGAATTMDSTTATGTANDTAAAPAPAAPAPAEGTAATEAPANADQETTAAIDRSTLTEVPAAELTAENLTGTTVYGANDERVGEIGDVALTADGQVDAIILDVGGFLGIGEKQVAVGMDNLQFMTDEDGDRYLYTQFTKEQLEAQPEYDEAGWAEGRDNMRMMAN